MWFDRYPSASKLTDKFVDDANLRAAVAGVVAAFQTKGRESFPERENLFDYFGVPRAKLDELRLALNTRFSIDLTVGEAQNIVNIRDILNAVRRDLFVSLNGRTPTDVLMFDTDEYRIFMRFFKTPFFSEPFFP